MENTIKLTYHYNGFKKLLQKLKLIKPAWIELNIDSKNRITYKTSHKVFLRNVTITLNQEIILPYLD